MGNLTKKDFEKIADIIKENTQRYTCADYEFDEDALELDGFVEDLSEFLVTTNKQFKKDDFMKACGVTNE